MKRYPIVACMLASAFGASALAQIATATPPAAPTAAGATTTTTAPAGPAKVAIILFQPAVAQTNEGQRDFGQLRSKFEPKQTQLKQQSDEIDSLKKKLQASGDKLSDSERQAQTRDIDAKEKALQLAAESAQNDFTGEMNDMYQQLAQKVYGVMQSYAQQNGYTVVLDASQQQSPVLFASDSTNITEAVVQAYNAKSGVPAQPAQPAGATGGVAPRTTVPNRAPAGTGAAPSGAAAPRTTPR